MSWAVFSRPYSQLLSPRIQCSFLHGGGDVDFGHPPSFSCSSPSALFLWSGISHRMSASPTSMRTTTRVLHEVGRIVYGHRKSRSAPSRYFVTFCPTGRFGLSVLCTFS